MDKMIIGGSTKKRFHCGDIVRMLEGFIVDNEIRGGTMLPNLSTLASQFSVSSSTMQRAMDVLARRKVIYRVRGQGSFVCEKVKPRYVSSVAYIVDDCARQYCDSLGLNYYAYERSREALVRQLSEEENCKVKVVPISDEWISDGKTFALDMYDCIIATAGIIEKFPQLYDLHHKTILVENAEFHRGNFNQVVLDYTPGFRQALHYYRERGVKRFFVCGCDIETSQKRYSALLEAALQEGYDGSCFRFYATAKKFLPVLLTPGFDCAEHYFALNDAECGIFSLSDYLTLGLLEAFGRRGLTLGRDVPMTSYDNLLRHIPELASQVTYDCIEHPLDDQAAATVELCHALLRSRHGNYSCTFTVPADKFIPAEERTLRQGCS